MKKLLIVILILAAVGAAAYYISSNSSGSKVLGKPLPEDAKPVSIAEALKHAGTGSMEMTVAGEITQKCPTSGCWFYLKDDTGSMRIDTQFSGFNVLAVASGSKVTVHGKIVKPEDGEPEMAASGMVIER